MPLADLNRRHILLIEDNEADAMLTRMVHEEVKHCSWLQIVYSGDEALEYLRAEGKFSDRHRPDVILMDMTLPAQSGLELIGEIRALPGCQFLPIVMISGSDNPMELRRAYELGANCVIKKSSSWEEYFRKLESCYEFWCVVVELPKSK
jgi:CheY-like chemotaxis protein